MYFPPPLVFPYTPVYYPVIMTGGTPPTNLGSGEAPPHNHPLAPQQPFTILHPSSVSDGEAGIAAPSEQPSNVAGFNSAPSDPEVFDDAPYVPPRVSHAVPPNYPTRVYDPINHDIQHRYPYEGGTSPSESHHSVDWSTSSSSSASSQQLLNDYASEPYSRTPRPPRSTSYPQRHHAYHGQPSFGLEHAEQPSNTAGPNYRTPQGHMSSLGATPDVNNTTNAHATIASQSFSSSSFSTTNRLSNVPTFSVLPPPVADRSRALFPDAGPYLRKQLGLADDAEVSLRSLPEPVSGEKPSTPLPMLIKLAIYGSPRQQLTLQEIYTELENRFQWFRDHKNQRAWKNSIRHNLSLNKVFKHVPRPITEPGKGSYWQLDVSGGEGYKRTRKRRPKPKTTVSEEEDEAASDMDEDRQSPLDTSQHAGPSRSSTTPVMDAHIDPELRSEGHVVGEGRARSATRRAGAGSPYPQQSPRYQQGPLPVVSGQDTNVPGHPVIRFGQPSLNFPTYSHARAMPTVPPTSSFNDASSSSMATGPQPQSMTSYAQNSHVLQPIPRLGLDYVMNPAKGLSAAQRVKTHLEPQKSSEENTEQRSSPESSSSESRMRNTRK